jgi:hypothetical protein
MEKFKYEAELEESTKEISKRREELRKGSLERQKIMDCLTSNKRGICPDPFSAQHVTMPVYQVDHEQLRANWAERQASLTPTGAWKPFYETADYEGQYEKRMYEPCLAKERPASANKAANGYYQRELYGKISNRGLKPEFNLKQEFSNFKSEFSLKPELNQFYRRRAETPAKDSIFEKENILRRAEEEATKKIEEIERRARLKVMEKRSASGV